jgi:hypothetical protein
LQQLQAGEQARQIRSFAAQADRCFEKHKELLGEGRGIDMDPGDPHFERRKFVLGLAAQDQTKATLQTKIDRAVEKIYGKRQAAPADALEARKQEWTQGGLAQPTNRTGASEPQGVAKAVQSVRNRMAELSADTRNGESGTVDPSDFL